MNFSTILSILVVCLVKISFVESTPGKFFYIALPVSNVSYVINGHNNSSRIISYKITIHNVNDQPVNVNISSPFPGFNSISQDISGLAVVNVSIPNFADLMQNSLIQNLVQHHQSFISNVTKQSLVIEAAMDIEVLVAALSSSDAWRGNFYSAQNILPVKHLGNTYSYFFYSVGLSTIFIVATNPMLTNVSASVKLATCTYSNHLGKCSYVGPQRSINSVLKQGEVFFFASPISPFFFYLSIDSDKPVAVFVQRIAYPALSSTLVPSKFVSQHGYPIVDITQVLTVNHDFFMFIPKYNDTKIQVDTGTDLLNLLLGIDDPPSIASSIPNNAVITSTKPIQILQHVSGTPFVMPSVDQFLSGNSSFLVPYFDPDNYATFIAISPQHNSFFLNGNTIDMDKWEYIANSTVYATQTVPVNSGANYVSASEKYMIIVSGNCPECYHPYAFVPNMVFERQKTTTAVSTTFFANKTSTATTDTPTTTSATEKTKFAQKLSTADLPKSTLSPNSSHGILHHLAHDAINETNAHEVLTNLSSTLAQDKDDLNSRNVSDTVTVLNRASSIPLLEKDMKLYFESTNTLLSVNGLVIKKSQQRENSSSQLLEAFDQVTRNFNGSAFLYNLTNIAISINTNDCSDESKIQIGIADSANQQGIIPLFKNSSQTMPAESLLTARAVVSQEDACSANRVMFLAIRNFKFFTPQLGNSYFGRLNSNHDSSENNPINTSENCLKKTVPSSGEALRVFLDRNDSSDGTLIRPVELIFKKKDLNTLHMKSIGGGFWELAVSRWSTDSCSVVSEDDQMIKFHCNHLTDFALLTARLNSYIFCLDIFGSFIVRFIFSAIMLYFLQDTIKNDPVLCNEGLVMFGYLSEGISTLTLALVFTASLMSSLCLNQRGFNPAKAGLLGLLLAFNFVFLIFANGSSLDLSESKCTIVAAILYTMMMSILCWTLFVGLGLFKLYYLIFERRWIRNLTNPRLTFGIAIGLPILLTVLLWFFKKSFFQRGDNFCWINPSSVGLGIMLPVSLVLASDLCLTGLLTWSFFGHKCTESSLHIVVINKNNRLFWKKLQLLVGMQFFLGAPWIAQYLTLWTPYLVPAHYVFTFLNATQGFWIACLYCMDHWKEFREIIAKWFAFRKLHKYSQFYDFKDSTSDMSENVIEVPNDTGNPKYIPELTKFKLGLAN